MQSDGALESAFAAFGVASFLVGQPQVAEEVGGGGVEFEAAFVGGDGGGGVSERRVRQALRSNVGRRCFASLYTIGLVQRD